MGHVSPPSVRREIFTPKAHRPPQGCPAILSPVCKTSTKHPEQTRELVHKFTTMRLEHNSKGKVLKNSLPLQEIHHHLEIDSLHIQKTGSSNVLLSTISFNCLVKKDSGEEVRDHITFDLRIPCANSEKETVFSYEMVEAAYGCKKKLYKVLKRFYEKGVAVANHKRSKHGHSPDYDHNNPKQDQYIRHTEQLLVAYLALPEASEMLCKRLRVEIRNKHADAITAKVYNMGLHMHSTKTCCAPCEYSLIGLMNKKTSLLLKNGKQIGFLKNFKEEAIKASDTLPLTLPQKSRFRLLVTVTASEHDATHRKQPVYSRVVLEPHDPIPSFPIPVKDPASPSHIFTSMLDVSYDRRHLLESSNLSDKTVGISGSKATPGTRGTICKVRAQRQQELDNQLSLMFPPNA